MSMRRTLAIILTVFCFHIASHIWSFVFNKTFEESIVTMLVAVTTILLVDRMGIE